MVLVLAAACSTELPLAMIGQWQGVLQYKSTNGHLRVLEQTPTKVVTEIERQTDPALILETFTLEGCTLTIVKMVQPSGVTMGFRHEHRLQRVAPSRARTSNAPRSALDLLVLRVVQRPERRAHRVALLGDLHCPLPGVEKGLIDGL